MTLNEAIIQVITNKYKKDAKEAHKIVEDAGYKINKVDGYYHVSSSSTYRYCYAFYSGHYDKGQRWCIYWGSNVRGSKIHWGDPANIKIDFTNLLNTRYNNVAHEQSPSHSPAVEKYQSIRWKKYTIKQDEKYIQDTLNSIANLNAKLISATELKAQHEMELANLRKENGLN